MKAFLQNERTQKAIRAFRPWLLFISVFFILKVTGIGAQINVLTQTALMKAGIMDIDPGSSQTAEKFDYEFSIKDLSGKTIKMSELKGKVIFINLWATWCGPCRVEMPSIQALYNDVDKDKIAFVILSLDQPRETGKIRKFIKDKGFTFPVYQPASPLPQILRVNTIPTTIVVGPDGTIEDKHTGMANFDTEEARSFLKELAE